jgi:ParB-like nuclease domain
MHIIPTWKDHPLTKQGVVELVPTDWLYTYRGQDVTPETETKDGTVVTLATLWENITKEGLHDPVIIRVGKDNQKFRLEAGNHRIQILHQHGVPFTPATVQVENWCGPDAKNVMNTGTHNFDFPYPDILIGVPNGYAKPSSIFKDLVHTICAR